MQNGLYLRRRSSFPQNSGSGTGRRYPPQTLSSLSALTSCMRPRRPQRPPYFCTASGSNAWYPRTYVEHSSEGLLESPLVVRITDARNRHTAACGYSVFMKRLPTQQCTRSCCANGIPAAMPLGMHRHLTIAVLCLCARFIHKSWPTRPPVSLSRYGRRRRFRRVLAVRGSPAASPAEVRFSCSSLLSGVVRLVEGSEVHADVRTCPRCARYRAISPVAVSIAYPSTFAFPHSSASSSLAIRQCRCPPERLKTSAPSSQRTP